MQVVDQQTHSHATVGGIDQLAKQGAARGIRIK
jgi:hypothetical protein